ncbi:MAG: class I SAM-dependent DNA methyltransferase, partial [Rhodococcus sp.]|nr:class I SAM-dependent DNA methyltransferase [Rhodococcus sp. (in: high G+C Gram-positive bacteria)]
MKTLEEIVAQHRDEWKARSLEQQRLEIENNEAVAKLYGLEDEVPS